MKYIFTLPCQLYQSCPRVVDQLAMECTIKALHYVRSPVQTSTYLVCRIWAVWVCLEVILVVVGIDPCHASTSLVADSARYKQKKNCNNHDFFLFLTFSKVKECEIWPCKQPSFKPQQVYSLCVRVCEGRCLTSKSWFLSTNKGAEHMFHKPNWF